VQCVSCLERVSVKGLEGCAHEVVRLDKRTIHGLDTTDSSERIEARKRGIEESPAQAKLASSMKLLHAA
jgi:hypothetical protein